MKRKAYYIVGFKNLTCRLIFVHVRPSFLKLLNVLRKLCVRECTCLKKVWNLQNLQFRVRHLRTYTSCQDLLYHLKIVKNTHGGILLEGMLLLVTFQAEVCNFTKSNTPQWVLFTNFLLYKCYQTTQSVTYMLPQWHRMSNIFRTSAFTIGWL